MVFVERFSQSVGTKITYLHPKALSVVKEYVHCVLGMWFFF